MKPKNNVTIAIRHEAFEALATQARRLGMDVESYIAWTVETVAKAMADKAAENGTTTSNA